MLRIIKKEPKNLDRVNPLQSRLYSHIPKVALLMQVSWFLNDISNIGF